MNKNNLLQTLYDKKIINAQKFVIDSLSYLTLTGSEAYGVSTNNSDKDFVGFCIPPKEVVFPHLAGYIKGFGTHPQNFENWSENHIVDKSTGTEYDFSVYGIVKFFELCRQNNPNMLDTLFTHSSCISYSDKIGDMVRTHRHKFLHKGCYYKFKGYAYSQLSKIKNKVPDVKSKRYNDYVKYGMDVKYAYHVVRLANECEQLLTEGTMDLRSCSRQLISIRNGEWTLDDLTSWFKQKEIQLDTLYQNSKALPHKPDEEGLKQLLLNCLEEFYGSLDNTIIIKDKYRVALLEIEEVLRSTLG